MQIMPSGNQYHIDILIAQNRLIIRRTIVCAKFLGDLFRIIASSGDDSMDIIKVRKVAQIRQVNILRKTAGADYQCNDQAKQHQQAWASYLGVPTEREIDLNELVSEVMGLLSQKIRYANVEIKTDLAAGLPIIKASPSEMQQVLLNLINNAEHAMVRADRSRPSKLRVRSSLANTS